MKKLLLLAGVLVVLGFAFWPASSSETPRTANPRASFVSRTPAPALVSSRQLPSDPIARARAVEALTRSVDDISLLRELIHAEPDGRVRERAIFAFADALGPDALPELRDIAFTDPDELAMAAAQASVYRIRNEQPLPARARIDVSIPETFVPGAPIEIVIRCAVDEFTPKARFAIRIPQDVEILGGDELDWRGPLAPGQVHERRYRIRASAPVELRARFSADFSEVLDAETVQLRIAVGDGTLEATTQLARN